MIKNSSLRIIIAVSSFLRILLSYVFFRLLLSPISSDKRKKIRRKVDEINARFLLRRLLFLRGLFIKVGQFLSVRADLLTRPYIKHLSTLQDSVPPEPFDVVKKRLEEELGEIGLVYNEFERSAIAAASLGQVHRAELKDGRKVAVKIQYPYIENLFKTDLKALGIILKIIKIFRKDLDTEKILKEFERYVSMELDYIQEGKNAEKISYNFRDDEQILVPRVLWEYTTKKVLTLEFIEGIKITEMDKYENKLSKKDVFKKVLDMYLRQIFEHGFFQADPHPGNIFVRTEKSPQPVLVLLDYGLCREISKDFIRGFAKLTSCLIEGDAKKMADAMVEIGFSSRDGKVEGFEKFSELAIKHAGDIYKDPRDIDFQGIVKNFMDIVSEYPLVEMPSEFILLGRTFGLLSGLARVMKTGVRVEKVLMPYLLKSFVE